MKQEFVMAYSWNLNNVKNMLAKIDQVYDNPNPRNQLLFAHESWQK